MRFAILSALTWALLLPAAISKPTAKPVAKSSPREAAAHLFPYLDSRAIRSSNTRVSNRRKKDPPEKYFHESSFHHHYDGRFATRELPYAERKVALVSLIKSYLTTMNEIGIQTWIMHGSLLGWWWNKRIMPWDSDLDVMVSEQAMEHLASYYNMTVHHHSYADGDGGRAYMLEINPHFRNTSVTDKYNRIDARWIDTKSGLFIDMTTLHHNVTAEKEGRSGAMMSKDQHHYDIQDIFPLRESVFEDVPCLIPYGYTELLIEEYGPMSLIKRDFANHHFDQLTMEWLPIVPSTKSAERISEEKKKLAEDLKKAEEQQAVNDKKALEGKTSQVPAADDAAKMAEEEKKKKDQEEQAKKQKEEEEQARKKKEEEDRANKEKEDRAKKAEEDAKKAADEKKAAEEKQAADDKAEEANKQQQQQQQQS